MTADSACCQLLVQCCPDYGMLILEHAFSGLKEREGECCGACNSTRCFGAGVTHGYVPGTVWQTSAQLEPWKLNKQ
jgi:hypothetical protein